MAVAYNRLSDTIASLALAASADTGVVASTFGTATVLNFNTITITDAEDTVDNSGGQDAYPMMRTTKLPFSVEIETMWGQGFTRPVRGLQARLTIVSTINNVSKTDVFTGRITAVNPTYSDSSTLRIVLSPYASAPSYS